MYIWWWGPRDESIEKSIVRVPSCTYLEESLNPHHGHHGHHHHHTSSPNMNLFSNYSRSMYIYVDLNITIIIIIIYIRGNHSEQHLNKQLLPFSCKKKHLALSSCISLMSCNLRWRVSVLCKNSSALAQDRTTMRVHVGAFRPFRNNYVFMTQCPPRK